MMEEDVIECADKPAERSPSFAAVRSERALTRFASNPVLEFTDPNDYSEMFFVKKSPNSVSPDMCT